MPLGLKPLLKLTHKLRLSPQIRLSLNLLQLPMSKLKEYIKEEAEKNPLLEIREERIVDKEISDKSVIDSGQYHGKIEIDEEKRRYKESLITKPPTLQEHLLNQLRLLTSTDKELKIGELIIGGLDDNGYLTASIEEISQYAKTTPSKVRNVLFLIQTFDPIGVGAQDLRECLLLQLKANGKENSLAGKVVDNFLMDLRNKKFNYIAKKLKISLARLKEVMKEIASLEPKPGRAFITEKTIRLIPDATLKKDAQGYTITLNSRELPRVTLNDEYKKIAQQKNLPKDTKEYLREKLAKARLLINAIKKRQQTIRQVVEEIVKAQRDFFDNEPVNFKPMTLVQIAEKINKHKSTVSRAMANKYIQTPHGIFELRYFLGSGIKQKDGLVFSSKNIKFKLVELIKNENKKKPLSDQKIVRIFKQKGIAVSRRAITKYRTQLKILPSKLRRAL